jgi:hypothetical protein
MMKGLCRAADPSCQTWQEQVADGHAGENERRDLHPENLLQSRPASYCAVPQRARVGTQKAGTSTDDGLKATILVADDALSSVIVLRTKNKDCLAIDFGNAAFHAALSHRATGGHDYALQPVAFWSTAQ